MKSRMLLCITAVALFVVLAIPVRLAAQDHQQHKNNHKHPHYKLIDLGTFGGPQSWVFGWNEVPGTMSEAGAVVGGADTSASNPNYPNFNPWMGLPFMLYPLNSDPFVEHAFQSNNGTLVDLGTLPGGYNSFAQWTSANGTVVGASENGVIDSLTGWPEARAVLWEDGQPNDLGTFGGNESGAGAVNNRSQVVGFATNTVPDNFLGFLTQQRAALWQKGTVRDLGTVGTGTDAIATNINEHGQVAGATFTNTIIDPNTLIPNQDPFFWQDDGNGMQDIGTLGGGLGFPNEINNRGQVVGQSNLAGDAIAHGFLWEKGVLTDLRTLGGSGSTAHWINDAGDIVGGASTPNDQAFHATLWRHIDLKITDLGALAGRPCSLAHNINSEGQIVGYSDNCNDAQKHAFLWEDGGPIVDLNTLVPPGSSLELLIATTINERGEIGGQGVTSNGDNHAFLLIPCDDNHNDAEGCENDAASTAAAARVSPVPSMQSSTTANQSNPGFRSAFNPMLRAFGRRLMPSRGLGAQPTK
jgi:probable HAF family extracellular repeat protein